MLRMLRSEKGASAVLIAGSMFLLIGLAAVAVDTAVAFDDRRQEQSAADTGDLAALQFAKTTLPTSICGAYSGANLAVCRGAEEAMAVVDANFPDLRYDSAAWAACTDPSKPAEFTRSVAVITPCISFTQNFQKARVVLPGTDVPTTFGRLLGRNSIAVGAFAEAGLDIDASAEIIPFAVGPTGAASSHNCLFANSSSNLNAYPCDGPVQGNFGKLDLALYGNNTLGTVEICGNANPTLKIATNLIVGVDHLLEIAAKSPGTVNDFTNCPIITNPVDNLPTQTGNSANGIENGLFNGIATPSREGRLMCKGGLSSSTVGEDPNNPKTSTACVTVNNGMPENLDHTPLWVFIEPGAAAEANLCVPSISDRLAMEACLIQWRGAAPHSTNLFTAAMADSPRFAAVPILDSDPSNGTGNYDIIEFRPVYLETLFLKCNANTCDIVHSPGEPSTGPICPSPIGMTTGSCGWPQNGTKGIVALSSFMLTTDMLHPDIAENFPTKDGTVIFNLTR